MKSPVKSLSMIAALATSSVLAGCTTVRENLDDRPNAGPCPVAAVLFDASRLVNVHGEERFANVGFTGEVDGVDGFCRYVGEDPITMDLTIDFSLGRGEAAQGDTLTYGYFVAVTRRDRAVIARESFTFDIAFPKGADRVGHRETVEGIVIPRASETVSGANFEVLVGFELTDEQLAFNRAGKRFRVDAGQ